MTGVRPIWGDAVKYFVVRDGGPLPRALVRVDGDREQELAGTGEWVGSALLAAPEPAWTVTEVESHAFYDHVYEAMREARAGLPCVAVLSTTFRVDEFLNVTAVMRRRDGVQEWLGRHLTPDNVWRAGKRAYRGSLWLPISEEELERHRWAAIWPSWFVVREESGRLHAVVRKIPSAEEAFTRDLRWVASDLLGREDLRVEELDRADSGRALEEIELEVHRERLRARGGPEYFTVENGIFDPRGVFCVIRRTGTGEEVHTGAGWAPSELLTEVEQRKRVFYRHRAVSAEEAGAVIAGRSGRRCFLLLDAPGELPLPLAVVRVDGDREQAFTRDLVWAPSDLLARVAEQPGVRVEEVPAGFEVNHAFTMAKRIRHERQRTAWPHDGHRYHAFFRDRAAALDLANLDHLHRTGHLGDAEYRGDGEWRSTRWSLEDYDRGTRDGEHLPVSPDEARWLTGLLDDR